MRPTLNQVSQQSDIVIIGNEADKFRALEYLISGDQRVIDLARLFPISKSNGS
jgi:hypothetical protein